VRFRAPLHPNNQTNRSRHAERGYQGRKELSLRQPTLWKILPIVKENMFESHPYRWSTIGSMEHLDTATLEDFKDFHKKFYIPNNAVLVVGDFEKTQKDGSKNTLALSKRRSTKANVYRETAQTIKATYQEHTNTDGRCPTGHRQ
jgi:predicted Zn-dependent peptidase